MANVTSKDGTKIAYTKMGQGPALILVDGALCYRDFGPSKKLADLLVNHFTVYIYDRRGRGESGDTAPYAVAREIEDIDALIDAAGGKAALFGQSSGGVLVLEAANKLGSKVTRLAIYETPLFVDDARTPLPVDFIAQMQEHLNAGRRGEPVKMFMKLVGAPGLMVAIMPMMPMWKQLISVSHTLIYDFAFMKKLQQGKTIPQGTWSGVTQPALVAVGGKSPAWMKHAMAQVATVLPRSMKEVLDGQTHMIKADVLAPVLADFLASEKAVAQ